MESQRDNSGILFKNDRATKETHPHYTGTCLINGIKMYVSAWVKKPEGKKPFFSLSFKVVDISLGTSIPALPAQLQNNEDLPF